MLEDNRIDIAEGTDVKMHRENVIFVIIGILKISLLSMGHIFPMVLIIQSTKLWCCYCLCWKKCLQNSFWHMSGVDVVSIVNNSNLINKKGFLQFFLLIYKKWVSVTPLSVALLNAIPLSLMSATPLNEVPLRNLLLKKQNVILKRAKDYIKMIKKIKTSCKR